MLLFFLHLRSQQKRTEKVISSCQIYIAVISTLLFESIAIINNVQNVRLQRRHRPRQTTPPLIDGVVHNRLIQQTMTHLLRHYQHFL